MAAWKMNEATRKCNPVAGVAMLGRFHCMKGAVLRCQHQQLMLNADASAVALTMVKVGCFCPHKCGLSSRSEGDL